MDSPDARGRAAAELSEDELLRILVEGTSATTGQAFFRALVEGLRSALGTLGAWIALFEPAEGTLRALSMKMGDAWMDGFEYRLEGTPCETAMGENRRLHVAERVMELYPRDPDLAPFHAVSYLGVPLLSADGEPIGQLAVLDDKPMAPVPRCLAVFDIFAARATAELRRVLAEEKIRERETQLSGLLDGAMDAIVDLDADLRILLVNRAAEQLFGEPGEALVGTALDAKLADTSATRLRAVARELSGDRGAPAHQWVGGGLEVGTRGGATFLAEATLARYTADHAPRYALILRDVNERLRAEETIRSLEHQTKLLREELDRVHGFQQVIGESPALLEALADVERVAELDTTVLLLGETGTGKEIFARALHGASARREQPLIKINCAAIPHDLIESELFGHEKGAFTGATAPRSGRFALAHRGTLFLDELGELPLALQPKLLRVLQEGEFERVGSSATQKVDVRIVAATNRDLAAAVARGEFREDLFYRLHVFPISIPPLRDRGDDVILLAERFAADFQRRIGRELVPLSADCKARLRSYRWPGNIRELQNVIERAVITCRGGHLDLAKALDDPSAASSLAADPAPATDSVLTIDELRALERTNLVRALERSGGKVSGPGGAAELLGMKPSTLASRIRALGVERRG